MEHAGNHALHLGDRFVQEIDHAELYMTHYAFFQEPDPGIVPGIYIDAATGQPTDELLLTPPFVRHALRILDHLPDERGTNGRQCAKARR